MAAQTSLQCIKELLDNEAKTLIETINLLLRISGNILKDPSNPKYRNISVASSVFLNKLVTINGAVSCLFEMGFQEGTDCLQLPVNSPLEKVRLVYNELLTKKNSMSATSNENKPGPSVSCETVERPSAVLQLTATFTNNFIRKIIVNSEKIMQYENRELQSLALRCIPIDKLQESVQSAIRNIQQEYKDKKSSKEEIDQQKLMLTALANWFKAEFFEWVDSPPCATCINSSVKIVGKFPSNEPGIDSVELHECEKCKSQIRFPRYNDVRELLLRSRRGRCGEWANCFTLLCRSMGWDARLVEDLTDHVWTEVYLPLSGRWVHCDPCEGVVDCPLMYEVGWNKKLTYVIAYSCEEIQDVTWRYTSFFTQVLQRRKLCNEEDLVQVALKLREIRGLALTPKRRLYVLQRSLFELTDLMIEQKPDPSALRGRSSGALAWRQTRGEVSQGFVWRVTSENIENSEWTLVYSPSRDEYTSKGKTLTGWSSGVFSSTNIQRKVEHDWKMVYIARCDGDSSGTIQWKVELDNGLVLGNVRFQCNSTVFATGSISISLHSDDIQVPTVPGESAIVSTDAFVGKRVIVITAVLSGGDGDVAWQHAQLFRQPIDASNQSCFHLTLNVKSLIT